jgi:hypothetical protein
MTPVTAGKVKYGVWGLICGAVIAMIIGFAWGGWTTERTTQRMGEEAVLAARAAICVAQFMKDPNHEEQLQALGKLISYQRKPSGGRNLGWQHQTRHPVSAGSLPDSEL